MRTSRNIGGYRGSNKREIRKTIDKTVKPKTSNGNKATPDEETKKRGKRIL